MAVVILVSSACGLTGKWLEVGQIFFGDVLPLPLPGQGACTADSETWASRACATSSSRAVDVSGGASFRDRDNCTATFIVSHHVDRVIKSVAQGRIPQSIGCRHGDVADHFRVPDWIGPRRQTFASMRRFRRQSLLAPCPGSPSSGRRHSI